jgi:hypothetical protein
MFSAPAFTPYVRYNFTSTTTGMTDFYFDTKFTTKSISGQILGMNDFIAAGMVANLGRNVLVGQEGAAGGFNNVSVAPTTNDSGTYHNLQVVNGARPSQLPGRTPVKIVIDISNTDTLVYSATTGKTLYITDLVVFIENSAAGSSRVNFVDSLVGATPIIYPMVLGEPSGKETASLVTSHTFVEPLEFDTGVYVDVVAGTNEIVGILNGYEE